jgi:hypothetical protein
MVGPSLLLAQAGTPSGHAIIALIGVLDRDVAKEIAGLASEGEPVNLSDGRKRKSAAQGH